MTTIKTKIRFVVQGQLNGGTFYDVSVHHTPSNAEKVMDRILKNCYPKWRGMDLGFRLIRRVETVKTDYEIRIFTSAPEGKTRSRLAELFIPDWLPAPIKNRMKMKPIP